MYVNTKQLVLHALCIKDTHNIGSIFYHVTTFELQFSEHSER